MEEMDVRAAHAHHLGAQHDLARPGLSGLRHVEELHRALATGDGRQHGRDPTRPWTFVGCAPPHGRPIVRVSDSEGIQRLRPSNERPLPKPARSSDDRSPLTRAFVCVSSVSAGGQRPAAHARHLKSYLSKGSLRCHERPASVAQAHRPEGDARAGASGADRAPGGAHAAEFLTATEAGEGVTGESPDDVLLPPASAGEVRLRRGGGGRRSGAPASMAGSRGIGLALLGGLADPEQAARGLRRSSRCFKPVTSTACRPGFDTRHTYPDDLQEAATSDEYLSLRHSRGGDRSRAGHPGAHPAVRRASSPTPISIPMRAVPFELLVFTYPVDRAGARRAAMRKLLRRRDARRYLIGQGLSLFGDTSLWLAAGIWVKDLTGSTSAAGLVFFAFGAGTLAAPLAGMLVDRVHRRPLLIWTNLATAGDRADAPAGAGPRGDLWLIYAVATASVPPTRSSGPARPRCCPACCRRTSFPTRTGRCRRCARCSA